MNDPIPLLNIDSLDLSIGDQQILRGVSLKILPGESVGLVGESGSGKSLTGRAILGLVPNPKGSILFKGSQLLRKTSTEMDSIRGKEIALVCQNPMSSLNPTLSIGAQLIEGVRIHQKLTKKQAIEQAAAVLNAVGLTDPHLRLRQYPDQLSGGMCQRVVIAMALICKPALLIADEPTTALDVTTQAQILDLLEKARKETGMSLLLISHDLGVVAGRCSQIYVLKSGRIVDEGTSEHIFYHSTLTYTRELCWKKNSLL